ncbi:uncharacterized protein UV8b_08052 [Ustilaginoidea virens]|uniref:Uncharacterized protein n=1 Tax=Ustilaginoidea virens TaxID=1159556 RepID=A0A8E5MLD3_USTVR|nr:uncharacterized protein UV8b_08052 [Ustilaginoidea virens]QUC23811.1 hypothetical protein UV8b_08052 [Ustilaginoidea virens]
MSSPDPLNDSTMVDLVSFPPSSATRRITRSQSSQQFLPLGASPRKPSSESHAGDRMSESNVGSGARRKLFQQPTSPSPSPSPSPSASPTPVRQRKSRTTTTTVPLRQSIEDEDGSTRQKTRGRQRISNGTPMPGAGTKRRADTPVRRTPRRPRTMTDAEVNESRLEASAQDAPTARRSLRARKNSIAAAASSEVETSNTPRPSTTARRGRRRRQALAPEELLELADEVGDISLDMTQLPPVTSDDEVDLVRAPSESTDDEAANPPPPASPPAMNAPSSPSPANGEAVVPDSDIWIASLSDEAMPPRPSTRARDAIPESSSPRFPSMDEMHMHHGRPEFETSQADDYGDYGYGDFAAPLNDRSSVDEPLRDHAQGAVAAKTTDFGSTPLGHGDHSSIDGLADNEMHVPVSIGATAYDTIAQGEEFSMIFMDSIQSLQPNFNSSVHPVGHEELGDETSLIISNTLESLRQRVDQEEAPDESMLQAGEDAQPAPAERQTTPTRQSLSPSTRTSPRFSRSPRKTITSSPLRHRVLRYIAIQAEESATAQANQDHEARSSPPSGSRALTADDQHHKEISSYEDSFSEIPEAVLTAATPRRAQASTSYDDLDDEVDQAQLEEPQDKEMAGEEAHRHGDAESTTEERVEIARAHDDGDVQYPDLSRSMIRHQHMESKQVVGPAHEVRVNEYEEDEGLEEEQAEHQAFRNQGLLIDWSNESRNDKRSQEIEVDELEQSDQHVAAPAAAQYDQDQFQGAVDENRQGAVDDAAVEGTGEYELEAEGEDVARMPPQAQADYSLDYSLREEHAEEQMVDSQEQEGDATSSVDSSHEEEQNDDQKQTRAVQEQDEYEEVSVHDDIEDDVMEEAEMQDGNGVAVSAASTAARPGLARLPTPDDTPPQAEVQAADSAGGKSSNRGSLPPSRLRYSPVSPGRLSGVARDASERLESSSPPPSRPKSSPRYPSLLVDVAQPLVQARKPTEDALFVPGEPVPGRGHEQNSEAEPKTEAEPEPEPEPEPEFERQNVDEDMDDQQPHSDEQGQLPDEDDGDVSTRPQQPRESVTAESFRRSLDTTPPHQISSPVQEPQSLQHETTLQKTLRPHLSAIVRAGQVLQSITSDPPSPEGQEKQLGSPFKRSGSKESWNGSRDSQTSHRTSRSPLQPRAGAQTAATRISPAGQDASAASPIKPGRPVVSGSPGQSQEPLPERDDESPATSSPASSMRVTPPSDGAMSWIAREGPISPSLRGDNSLREAARLPERQTASPAAAQRAVQQPSEAAQEPPREAAPDRDVPDDETDIWELEAQRETPRPPRQQSFGKRVPTSNHRRGAIPSPWTKRSVQRPAASRMISQAVPDLSHLTEEPTVGPEQGSQSSEPDEYSRLAQRQQQEEREAREAEAAAAAKRAAQDAEPAGKGRRFDLSSFFSSPTAIPGMLAQKLMRPSQASTQMSMADKAPPVVPTSSMFPQIPQREFRPDSSAKSMLMQLSHADIHRWTQQTSNASEASSDFQQPLLRPLPPKNASPAKSALRSPLKPHTPGRVVEFTSSVLSPGGQARARHDRLLSAFSLHSDARAPASATEPEDQADSDTQDVYMEDAPPLAKQQPLSQTTWTRQHWLLLDELLQMRRKAPFGIRYARRADRYLGKTVKSHGEAMILERWHLDCVDAFRAEVGGWDEAALAKRLFALILGEERRGRRQRVMFH